MRMSKLMQGASDALLEGGEQGVDDYIKSLTHEQQEQLMEEVINGMAKSIGQMMLANLQDEIESHQVFRGFGRN